LGELGFIHPYLLAGLAGAAIPLIIHLLYRRRARVIRFSAIQFVLLSYKKVARKLLLREYLLLAARCLLIAALALALARPVFSRMVQAMSKPEGPAAYAIIIDNSYSMLSRPPESLGLKSGAMLERAKKLAENLIRSMEDVDEAALLFTTQEPGAETLATGLTTDRKQLLEAARNVRVSYTNSRPAQALNRAGLIIEAATQPSRLILLITDMQRYGWSEGVSGEEWPAVSSGNAPDIYIFDMAAGEGLENMAVGELSIESVPLLREARLNIQARVHNFGKQDSSKNLVQVSLGEEILARGFLSIKGRSQESKEFILSGHSESLGHDQRQAQGTVEITTPDALLVDNRAYFHLSGGGKVQALVVDGDPKTELRKSETYFLDKALNPMLYHRSRIDPTTIVTDELEDYQLQDFQVLVLCNVANVSRGLAAKIRGFVEKGGGLLFTLGDRVEADLYNSTWEDLLPRELRGVKSPYAGAEAEKDIRTMHIDRHFGKGPEGQATHPVLSVFQDPDQGDMGLADFTTYFLLQPEVKTKSRVILRLTNGTPLMLEKSLGKGRVILYASSADLAWNDFCLYPTYLPLFHQTVQYLARSLQKGDPGRLLAGSIVEVACPEDMEGALVMDPEGNTSSLRAMEYKGQRLLRVKTSQPGVYYLRFQERLSPAGALAFSENQADQVLVLNLDLRESDLERISEAELKKILPAESLAVVSPEKDYKGVKGLSRATGLRRIETTVDLYMLLVVVGLLAAELLLLRRI
jgi:hypothetical protein